MKEKKIWFSVPMVLTLVYLGGNPDPITTVDYLAYESEYNNRYLGYVSRFEWLYQKVANIAVKYNLQYFQFRLILMLLIFIVLFIAVRRLTKNDKLFWLLFSFFPFFVETVQVRSFAMISLVLLAVSFLKYNKFQGYFTASVLIYLSTGFHTSGFLFFLILPVQFIFYKKWTISMLNGCLITCLVISIIVPLFLKVGVLNGLTTLIQSISDDQEVINNVTTLYFNGISVSSVILLLSALGFFILVINILKQQQIKLDDNLRVLFSYSCVTFIGMPLLMISSQYDRILREGIIGMLIILSIVFENKVYLNKYIFQVTSVYFAVMYVFMGGYRLSPGFLNMLHYIGI